MKLEKLEITEGARLVIGDMRRSLNERVLVEGHVWKIEEDKQLSTKSIYLDTGYYVIVYPKLGG